MQFPTYIFHSLLCSSLLFPASLSTPLNTADSDSRIIDLGYARHRPTSTNTTASGDKILSYMNIRFAQPPTRQLRFRKPVTPPMYSNGIQNGTHPPGFTDCISSASPQVPFPDINGTTWGHEDCLFLNVLVPEGVHPGDDVPVLHWVFGSAYAFGSKDSFVDSMGIFDGMKKHPGEKFIFVANNYRLGMPGWTASPEEDMDANVGLHDTVAAVEWTKKYISFFGGDPNQITVMGQSAGAGIINLMITGEGGRGDCPFQQAFLSSPDVVPRRNVKRQRQELYEDVLKATNCTSLACLRKVPESTLLAANDYLINVALATGGGGNFGPGIGFSPVVDGTYVPDLPSVLLQQGRYHKSVQSLIIGNMKEEGMGISSDSNMPQAFPSLVRKILPTASNATIAAIQAHFPYPPDLPEELAWDWTTAIIFECNAYNLATALKDKTRRYIMSIPPAIHGQDMSYLSYPNQAFGRVADKTIALQYQGYLREFVAGYGREGTCAPNTAAIKNWPFYGKASTFFNITSAAFVKEQMPRHLETTCQFLNQVLADPANGA